MIEERGDVDVSELPTVVFGPRGLLWWGTIAFMLIEGFTIVLMVASYFYLRLNERVWPPPPTPDPDLLIPTINTLLLLSLIAPMVMVQRAAERFDRKLVTTGLVVTTLLTIPVPVLRYFELDALNTRWDTHAYGSAAWGLVVLHGSLVLFDLLETGALAFLFAKGDAQIKHYSDAADAALYQYYLSLIWVPLYLVVYWGPRVL